MNCQEAQTQISQLAEGHPSAALVAHARGCEQCKVALESALHQQAWLRREFAEASAILLSEAPSFSEADLRQQLQSHPESSSFRPLLWAAAAAAIIVIAGTVCWFNRPVPVHQPALAATTKSQSTVPKKQQPPAAKTNKEIAAKKPAKKASTATNLVSGNGVAPIAKPSKKRPSTSQQAVTGSEMKVAPSARSPSVPNISSHSYTISSPNPALPVTGQIEALVTDTPQGEQQATLLVSASGLTPEVTYTITAPSTSGDPVVIGQVTANSSGQAEATISIGAQPQSGSTPSSVPAPEPSPVQPASGPNIAANTAESGQSPVTVPLNFPYTTTDGFRVTINLNAITALDPSTGSVVFSAHVR